MTLFNSLADVLGLLYVKKDTKDSLDEEIENLIQRRVEARKNKNWAEADRIRDELKAKGIEVTDVPGGAVWKRI